MLRTRGEVERLHDELAAARARIAALEARHADSARRDPRTGALPLEAFRAAAGRELERSRRSGAVLSLLIVDIDGFRAINGRRGPGAGDAALAAVAARLGELVRANDLVARSGADELAVLMPDTRLEGARACAQRLVVAMEAEVPAAGWVTVSAGVAEHERGCSLDALMAAAGAGVDRARLAGGARVATPYARDALEDARRDAHADAIEALAMALLERDRYTGEHSESVVGMAKSVARSLGLGDDEVERVGAAALLHDIGKVAIPDTILNKPTELDEAEWRLMREHPVIGERILRAVPGMGAVARIVRHEHERFDGSGYPDGLAGDAIPIGSRIILACDTYHAMTSDRPYRSRLPHADAIAELARCAGDQFDPRVTEALIGLLYRMAQAGEIAR